MSVEDTALLENFRRDGAVKLPGALSSNELADLNQLANQVPNGKPAMRLIADPILHRLLRPGGALLSAARRLIGENAFPARAILFDKTPDNNWALGWHQDRTVAVRQKIDMPGFGTWTRKAGLDHVEPPFSIIEGMATLRAHLDDCHIGNAPLRIVPGSHLLGRLTKKQIRQMIDTSDIMECEADAGDIWAYASAIVHASAAATKPTHRRVLHIDFAAHELPGQLEWLGV